MPTLDELESHWQPLSQDVIRAMRDWRRQHPRATFKDMETALDELACRKTCCRYVKFGLR
jgi:DNA-directed RNA polymerase subunit N (RpoN/RPB10)